MHAVASNSRVQLRALRARLVQHGGAGALEVLARGQAERQALRRRAARLVVVAVVPAVAGQQAHGAGAAAGDRQRQAAAPALHAGRQVAQQRSLLVEHAHVPRQRDLRARPTGVRPADWDLTTTARSDEHRLAMTAAWTELRVAKAWGH